MYQSEEPLSLFFEELLYSAKNAGYKLVVTLLAREADSEEKYSEIVKHWASLHDVTGKNILFVLNAPNGKSKFSEDSNLLYKKGRREDIAHKNEHIAFASGVNLQIPHNEKEIIRGHLEPDSDLKKSHSREITSLQNTFDLEGKDIPSLLIFMLNSNISLKPSKIVPLSDIGSIYQYLKKMNENLEKLFIQLESISQDYLDKSGQLKTLQKDFKSTKPILNSSDFLFEVEDKALAKKSAEKIYKECTIRGSRKKCFTYLNIVKKEMGSVTNLIRALQSKIDKTFFLSTEDWNFKQSKIKNLEIDIENIEEAKEIIWQKIFDVTMNLQKYIFISHSSKEKEHLALPLYDYLESYNLKPWIDKKNMKESDSIFMGINNGIKESNSYVVILSTSFIDNNWTKKEFNAIVTQHTEKGKRLFIILHDIAINLFKDEYPLLADLIVFESRKGMREIAKEIRIIIENSEGN